MKGNEPSLDLWTSFMWSMAFFRCSCFNFFHSSFVCYKSWQVKKNIWWKLIIQRLDLFRYWAITDPFNYPIKMSDKRAAYLIIIVWICSSSISFPAIAWWRLTANGKIVQLLCQPWLGHCSKFIKKKISLI